MANRNPIRKCDLYFIMFLLIKHFWQCNASFIAIQHVIVISEIYQ